MMAGVIALPTQRREAAAVRSAVRSPLEGVQAIGLPAGANRPKMAEVEISWNDLRWELDRLARELSCPDFVKRFPHPFLLVGDFRNGSQWSFETRLIEASSRLRHPDTLRAGTKETQALIAAALRDASGAFPVAKTPRNPLRKYISVGRTRNNDIVFPTRFVSKVHAFFARTPAGDWELCDRGSTNGTFLNGVQLRTGEWERVRIDDVLRFGYIEGYFVRPERAYAVLRGE
jgi:hypothetical protein